MARFNGAIVEIRSEGEAFRYAITLDGVSVTGQGAYPTASAAIYAAASFMAYVERKQVKP